jgi:hypothetical protein
MTRFVAVFLLLLTATAASATTAKRCARLCSWSAHHCGLHLGRHDPRRCTGPLRQRCDSAGFGCDVATTTVTTTTETTTTTTTLNTGFEIAGLYSASLEPVDDGCGLLLVTPYTPGLYLLNIGADGFYVDMGSTLGTSGKIGDTPAVLWSGPNPDTRDGTVTAVGGLTCQAFELNGLSECCFDAAFTLTFGPTPMAVRYVVERRCISSDAARLDCTTTMTGTVSPITPPE